jgi:hypothetical protein
MKNLKRLSAWLVRAAAPAVVLASMIVFVAFMVFVLPGQAAAAETYSAGVGSPDTTLLYSSQDLSDMASVYGQAGRQAYIRARWGFDLAFPLVYAAFLTLAISWLLTRALPAESPAHLLNLLPPMAMLADFLENSLTTLVMVRFPNPAPLAFLLAPPVSALKWLLVSASFLLLPLAAVLALLRKKQ